MYRNKKFIGRLERLAAMLLALFLVLPLLPATGETVSSYGMTLANDVNFRPSIGTSDYIDRLPQGWVARILEISVHGATTWYKVETVTPKFSTSPAKIGYIHGGFFRPFTSQEEASWLVSKPSVYGGSVSPVVTNPSAEVTNPPSTWVTEPPSWQAPTGYVKVVLHNTNLREQPESSKIFVQIPKGKILPYYGDPVYRGSYQWQYVYYQDKNEYGYIRSDCYAYTTQTGEAAETPKPGNLPSYPPMGHVIITLQGTNLRNEPGDLGGKIITRLDKGKVLPYYSDPSWTGGYQWQPVYVADLNLSGYIRSDCYAYTDAQGVPTETPKPAPSTWPDGTTYPSTLAGRYALTAVSGVNLRQTENGISITALPLHTQLDIVNYPTSIASPWYRVKALGYEGYVHEDQIRILSEGEAAAWLAYRTLPQDMRPGVTGTPGIPAATSGILRIILPGTNLRKTPGGTSLMRFDEGTELPYIGAPTYHMGYYWAHVTDNKSGMNGYVRSDCYTIIQEGSGPVVSPTPSAPPTDGQGTLKLTLGGVNLRQTPGGAVLTTIAKRGTELPYFSAPTFHMGYYWAYVYYQPQNLYGYVRSDCYEIVGSLPQPTGVPGYPTATPPPSSAAGYLKLIKGGVNLRNAPAGGTIAQLDRDLELAYFSVTVASGYTWYQVDSPKGRGWVRSDVVTLIDGPGGDTKPVPTATPDPSAGNLGYILTIKSAINLRQAPSSSVILGRVDKGLVYALMGPVTNVKGYNWYQISVNGQLGYLRGDCVRQLTPEEVTAYLAGTMPGVTPPPTDGTVTVGHVITIVSSVNVRETPSLDSRSLAQIAAAGAVFPYESTVTAGGRTWFKINYQGKTAYLLHSTARMMTPQEYQDYLNGRPTTPPVQPTLTPDASTLSSTAVTVMNKVLLRKTAGMGGQTLTTLYKQGTIVTLLGATEQTGGYTWYSVRAAGVNGWIRGDMIRILSKAEADAQNQNSGGSSTASYRRLSIGSTGEDVTRLQRELSRLGYLRSGYSIGVYDQATQTAVRNYQMAAGLFVDGIAGNDTQHKLYNTTPQDTYTPDAGGTVNPTIYPVEKVDWYSGDINSFWARGETAILTDVKTRISFRVKRWAGGYHADVEPLTAADTAAMCEIYGVKNAQEILEKNLYQRRPVWITLKGRSFAASIYGIPHNYPEGDTIPDNKFNGQFCVHFVNSRLHTGGKVDKDHQKAINEAYNAAPSRK
ncbi:MAG: peptidoglycan-binding protein [Christensenellales bacterium]|jgi:peptidoglycan hydrolase-like protein with peptidoglycan-binding domain